MEGLNRLVEKYLESNGIMMKFFANYIGCDLPKCSRWINGKNKLNAEQLRKTHEFLNGNYMKSVEEIMKEG